MSWNSNPKANTVETLCNDIYVNLLISDWIIIYYQKFNPVIF